MRSIVAALLSLTCISLAHAVGPGQLDDFQDGTTRSWANGGGSAPPVLNIATGGPAGAGDRYMQISAIGGMGAGNRLTVFNRDQWLGDFVGQGIVAVEMDLNNFSSVALNIRLGFKEAVGPGTPGYVSQAFSMAANSGWQHVVFAINMATMIAIGGPADFNTFFSGNFAEARIINAANPDLNGDIVVGQLGIDNIHAIPEPGALALVALGLLSCVAIGRNRICARR